ncbi:hypothetical protein MKY08_08645 [Lysinibacillus sp. FSL M8-0337]|uniref:Uncharacterized protein n=1 Tax=Lysinibacillus sphaericus TaxID=1421 RepID=A0A2S5D1A5_LYSSH|nr:hypothetical protein [Lysinibacillus sphaericus]POZ56856.1 hypothetical protein LYSIN_01639 [Lysinibacillus sphaericus]
MKKIKMILAIVMVAIFLGSGFAQIKTYTDQLPEITKAETVSSFQNLKV